MACLGLSNLIYDTATIVLVSNVGSYFEQSQQTVCSMRKHRAGRNTEDVGQGYV